MSARYAALLPSTRQPPRQHGAALILAILTVALVAGLAAAIVGDYGAAVASVSGRHDQAQARLLARGAVDWARNILQEARRTSNYTYAGEAWATHVPPTPVEEGEVAGEIEDASGRFNLNALVDPSGLVNQDQVGAYVKLLGLLGVGSAQADDLALALVDWLDPDNKVAGSSDAESDWYAAQTPPRQPANAPLVDVDELTLVRGYDAGIVALLRPFVAALPERAKLNVNTASAEVLAAMVPRLGTDSARIMTAQMQNTPFRTAAEFQAGLPSGITVDPLLFDVSTRYFLASGRAHFGEATTRMQVLLDRPSISPFYPTIVWQKIL
jgi:general secretion pathway protein K